MERKPETTGRVIRELYAPLFSYYGLQGWWPLRSRKDSNGYTSGGYHPGISAGLSLNEKFEISAGAVLTQNTAWNNAASAIDALLDAGLLSPEAIASNTREDIAALIRSSGYFNQKALRLKTLADFYLNTAAEPPDRDALLMLKGIGPETADSILLYAWDVPVFVIDAYTRRLMARTADEKGLLQIKYEELRQRFEQSLDESVELYQEYHALIVIQCKTFCRKIPLCGDCPIVSICRYTEK